MPGIEIAAIHPFYVDSPEYLRVERFIGLCPSRNGRMKVVSCTSGDMPMKYESIHGTQIPVIGFGTWSIGGEMRANPAQDSRSLAALRSALELGYTHFDTAEMYAAGHSEELLGRAIRESGIPRKDLFITSKVTPANLRRKDILTACKNSLHRLQMDYLDLYLIHWPSSSIPLEDSFLVLNQLVRECMVRHLGVSNFDLGGLKRAVALSESPLLTDQVPYSLYQRSYSQNGVLAFCQANEILLTAYSPVEEGRLRETDMLRSIAAEHNATSYQIALAWLVAQPRVITIPMSFDPVHQAENLAAADLVLSDAEKEQFEQLSAD
jgi:2,5-diketo-D-gluconate reductase B